MATTSNKSNFMNKLKLWISDNPILVIGIVIGLILAIAFFTIGPWITISLIAALAIGFWAGINKNKKGSIIDRLFKNLQK